MKVMQFTQANGRPISVIPLSVHSIEPVQAAGGDDARVRLSLSGGHILEVLENYEEVVNELEDAVDEDRVDAFTTMCAMQTAEAERNQAKRIAELKASGVLTHLGTFNPDGSFDVPFGPEAVGSVNPLHSPSTAGGENPANVEAPVVAA